MIESDPAPARKILPSGPLRATLTAPSSKSYTNRALLLAGLTRGVSRIRRPLASDDTRRMREALEAFGVAIEEGDGWTVVEGRGSGLIPPKEPVRCGLSGTTIRFLTAVAALCDGETELTGDPPLLRRPIAPLADALESLGARIRYLGEPGYPPLLVRGPLRGGEARVDASRSSQFLTALLMAAPLAAGEVRLRVTALVSRPYIDMTRSSMAAFGVMAPEDGHGGYIVPDPQAYSARDYEVEYDASSAAHLLAPAALAGGSVTLTNAASGTVQADARFADYLSEMGCEIERDGERLTVRGNGVPRPLRMDLSDTPDMTIPLSVLCAYASGESRIENVAVTRGHETDRLAATAAELRKMGIDVVEMEDGLRIRGGEPRGAVIETYHDHRMAMGFAAAGARTPDVVIRDPGCVSKTYPEFWRVLAAAGIESRPVRDRHHSEE